VNKLERVQAALRGKPVDRVPVALWRHFPEQDQTAEGLAALFVAWQARYDWDFVKVTPASGYPYEDWGARFTYRGNDRGVREVVSRPFAGQPNWNGIRPLDVTQGVLGREVRAVRLVADQLGRQAPILATLFSPGFSVQNLTERDRFLADLRGGFSAVRPAFEAATETTIALARAYLDAGAQGIFYSTLLASSVYLTEAEYRDLILPYDRAVLDAIRPRTDFILLHIHGEPIYFDLLTELPVDAINWHDRETPPSLAEARTRFGGALVGGLRESVLQHGTPADVTNQVRATIQETGGRGIIVATGCVTPVVAPEPNIRAAREAVLAAIA
jgi:uroporphyrinogen decarboxylase